MIKRAAFKAAFPYTIPICTGFLVLGIAYGIYMSSKGFAFIYPLLMSLFIFAGSMELVTVELLLSTFNPLYVFFLTIMINARHLFYGISLLEKYKNIGKKKWYLIYGMCDESFSINCSVKISSSIDRGWFMFFVTLLNHIYWVLGATLGGLLGQHLQINTKGIDFVLPALFVVMLLEQFKKSENKIPCIIGLIASFLCRILLGPNNFMIPSMLLISFSLLIGKKYITGKNYL